jgi:ribokinase
MTPSLPSRDQPPRVCVVGSSNVDLIVQTERLPRPGETVTGRSITTVCGGKGGNQAVMAARLGAVVLLVGKVGRDDFGERLRQNYREQGIDTTHLLTDDSRPSGVATILVDDAANNCILVVPGANEGLTPEDVRGASAAISGADVLLCQLEVPLAATVEALRLAAQAQVKTILNPAPARALSDEVLALADLCIPNESELELLTGMPASTPEEAAAAAQALLARGPGIVLVTLGERGALLVDREGCKAVLPRPVQAVDPSGAGDVFIGSLAVFLAEGSSLLDAATKAAAVAALSVTRPGTQTSFPTADEVRAFLA